jgi:hypothetical protein
MGTPTATVRATKPTVGGDIGLWMNEQNAGFDAFDAAINQQATINIPDANVVLTADGSAADNARQQHYVFTGALTANRTVTLPACQKRGYAADNTSGGHSVILTTGSGTTLTLLKGGVDTYFNCDGTNVTQPVVAAGTFSAAAAGYSRLPGGITIQWGNASTGVGAQTVTFPIAFSGTPWSIQLTLKDATVGGPASAVGVETTTAYTATTFGMLSFNTATGAAVACNFFWFAVGPT